LKIWPALAPPRSAIYDDVFHSRRRAIGGMLSRNRLSER
jgi:hypothetical protein